MSSKILYKTDKSIKVLTIAITTEYSRSHTVRIRDVVLYIEFY